MNKDIMNYLELYNINTKTIKDNNDLINLFFGTLVTETIIHCLDNSYNFIENKEPVETFKHLDENIQKKYIKQMDILSKLNCETKDIIKQLIKTTLESVLFDLFVKMDDTPQYGKFKIIFESENGEENGIVNYDSELHEDLFKWKYLYINVE